MSKERNYTKEILMNNFEISSAYDTSKGNAFPGANNNQEMILENPNFSDLRGQNLLNTDSMNMKS